MGLTKDRIGVIIKDMKKYQIIYADPPWSFDGGIRSSKKIEGKYQRYTPDTTVGLGRYDTMLDSDIVNLPINSIFLHIIQNNCDKLLVEQSKRVGGTSNVVSSKDVIFEDEIDFDNVDLDVPLNELSEGKYIFSINCYKNVEKGFWVFKKINFELKDKKTILLNVVSAENVVESARLEGIGAESRSTH